MIWPAHCCVPAFVSAALAHQQEEPPPPGDLARMLDVRVPTGSPNPFALLVSEEPNRFGVSPAVAFPRLGALLERRYPALAGSHLTIDQIPFRMAPEACEQFVAAGVTVGIGLDNGLVGENRLMGTRHVLRVTGTSSLRVDLMDDSEDGVQLSIDWADAEKASLAVNDGFWLIGHQDHLGPVFRDFGPSL